MREVKVKVKVLFINKGVVNLFNVIVEFILLVIREILWVVFCYGVSVMILVFFVVVEVVVGVGGGVGWGVGGRIWFFCVIIVLCMILFFRLMLNFLFFGVMDRKNLVILFEYRVEDWVGSLEGKLV